MDMKLALNYMDYWYYFSKAFQYRWEILFFLIVLRWGSLIYKELVFTPLAGGNGKVQMDELAKYVVIVSFVFSSYIEGSRKHEWHIFSDAYWFALLGSVCIIGGLKNVDFSKMFTKSPPDENKG